MGGHLLPDQLPDCGQPLWVDGPILGHRLFLYERLPIPELTEVLKSPLVPATKFHAVWPSAFVMNAELIFTLLFMITFHSIDNNPVSLALTSQSSLNIQLLFLP